MNKFLIGAALFGLMACNGETTTEPTDSGETGETGATGTGDTGPNFTVPVFITSNAFFGWDATNSQFVQYTGTTSQGAATQGPAMLVSLYDGTATAVGDKICDIYISYDASTTPLPNTTSVGGDTVAIGMVLDTANAGVTVTDGAAVGLTSCIGALDESVWTADLAAAVKAGGQDFGFIVSGPLTGGDLYNGITTQIPDFATDWQPYFLSGSSYYEVAGVTMGLFSQGGTAVTIGFGRSESVDANFDAGTLGEGFVARDNALTTDGAFTMQTIFMPFGDADKAWLLGN